MTCPNCQATNPDGAKFCASCGTSLAPRAASPSPVQVQVPPPGAAEPSTTSQPRHQQYMPRGLLTKLEAAREARDMVGERRIVTALFCDVKGSTAMAEQLDPEEWTEVMNGAFEYLIAPVYRYEGTLARLMGDAIVAFFGAPIAHEDDAWRAVLAGLAIVEGVQAYREQVRRERGLEFDVRVGINTGLVVVGEIGSDLHVEYTAMGDAVNLAARMEQTAEPGTVQISGNTHRLVASLFDFESLGGIEVKGKAQPVEAYRVLRPRERAAPARGIEGLRSPLVGRDRELQALRAAVDELLAGRGQIVSVTGEAGLGKSRLVAELRQSLADAGLIAPEGPAAGATAADAAGAGSVAGGAASTIRWYEGRAFSHETSIPYTPFRHLLGSLLGVSAAEAGPLPAAARGVDPFLRQGQPYASLKAPVEAAAPGFAADVAPFLATLLGVEVTGDDADRLRFLQPPQVRERVFEAVRQLLERLAEIQPVVLVFEDLHWADPTSLDLLEALLPLTDSAMLMVIALFRPHRDELSWRFHELAIREYVHRYTAIALEPLSDGDARTLVANLLHVEDLPERIRGLILTKADGNPFFIEEVIRSLLDAGLVVRENNHWRATREIETIVVPDTLAGVITARLDRLDDDARRVAQAAAVIGREFRFDVLAEVHDSAPVLDRALTTLQRRELVRERSRAPQRLYAFKHVFTQETAYASLLLSRRRELHRRVAGTLERLVPDQVSEIGRHFLEAREPARALPYLVEAGERAARAYATAEAVASFRQALAIVESRERGAAPPAGPAGAREAGGAGWSTVLARRLYEGLGMALELANDGPAAAETYRAMLAFAQAGGDVPMQVSALNKLAGVLALRRGQLQEAERLLATADRLARESGDRLGSVEQSTLRCAISAPSGHFDGAISWLGESVNVARDLGVPEQLAETLGHFSFILALQARFDDAWAPAQEGLAVAEQTGDLVHRAEILSFQLPMYHLHKGDLAAARRAAAESVDIAARIGAAVAECRGAALLAGLAQARGEYESAVAWNQRALSVTPALGELGGGLFAPGALAALGAVYMDVGPQLYDETAQAHAAPLAAMEATAGASAWADMGFCALARGDVDRAEALFQRGLTTPSMTWLVERPRLLAGAALAALARSAGRADLDGAVARVEEARTYATEHAMQHLYPLIDVAAGRIHLAHGDAAAALARFAKAETLAVGMGLRPLAWEAQARAAEALAALGRTDEADAKRRAARAIIQELAASFQDRALGATYLEHALSSVT